MVFSMISNFYFFVKICFSFLSNFSFSTSLSSISHSPTYHTSLIFQICFLSEKKASIPGISTTHTLHTKGRKDRNKLFWVRQASLRKRVPEADKRIRDTSLHLYGSHKNIKLATITYMWRTEGRQKMALWLRLLSM